MDVLSKSVPRYDAADPDGSLRDIFNYLSDTMEQIDYTLSRQGIQLGKVSLPGTAEEVTQLRGEISAMSSLVSGHSASLSAIQARVSTLEERADGAAARLAALETAVTANTAGIADLEQRVSALEGAEGGT